MGGRKTACTQKHARNRDMKITMIDGTEYMCCVQSMKKAQVSTQPKAGMGHTFTKVNPSLTLKEGFNMQAANSRCSRLLNKDGVKWQHGPQNTEKCSEEFGS